MPNDLDSTHRLLRRVFPHNEHFQHDRYLQWWYRENPYGSGIEHDLDEDGVRVAHTAYVPNRFTDIATPTSPPLRGALSCDSAVDPDHQRSGLFRQFQTGASEAAAAGGMQFGYGCANWNSLVVFQKHLGWRHVQPLPVRILIPTPGRRTAVESIALDEAGRAHPTFAEVISDIDTHAAPGLHTEGNQEWYEWRCASPSNAFTLHAAADAACITTRVRERGVPITVIVRTISRNLHNRKAWKPLVRAACRYHRTPLAIYVGFNEAFDFRGITPPRKLLPSPLHMCVKSLQPEIDQDALQFGTYELLDFDAY